MRLEMPFTGRDDEFEAVCSLLRDGRAGAVVSGDAGIGKSRLASAVAAAVAREGIPVATIRATDSLREMPFAPFAPLLGELLSSRTDRDRGVDILAAAPAAIRASVGPNPLIVVDDVDLLDGGSAALVEQLCASGAAQVLATVCSGRAIPCAVAGLLREGMFDLVTLEPFTAATLAELAERTLGGPIDPITRGRIITTVEGNALYLRELLIGGLSTGALVQVDGRWTWTGPMSTGTRLSQVLTARIAADTSVGDVLRYVAFAQPLSIGVLEQLVAPDLIDIAEQQGLITVDAETGRRHRVRVAHPLYAVAVLETLGARLERRMACALVDAIEATGLRRGDDELECARFELRCGRVRDPQRLDRAARTARDRGDLALAERLGRAAVDEGAGIAAVISLADTLIWSAQFESTLDLVSLADTRGASGDELALLDLHRATALYFGAGAVGDAMEALEHAHRTASSPSVRATVVAQEAELRAFSGEAGRAEALGRKALASPCIASRARAAAYGAIVPSLALRGLLGEARSTAVEAFEFARPSPPQWEAAGVAAGMFIASLIDPLATGPMPVEPSAEEFDALARATDSLAGIWVSVHGRDQVARGDVVGAVATLTDGVALLTAQDPGRFRPWAVATLAGAHGLAGDAAGAAAMLAELDRLAPPARSVFCADVAIGRAWAEYAAGGALPARTSLLVEYDELVDAGLLGVAATVWWEAFRLGAGSRELVARAAPLAGREGFVVHVVTEIVSWLRGCRADTAPLQRLAEACAARNRALWAAELAATAADAASGERARRCAEAKAKAWLSQCPGARTPRVQALCGLPRHARLTEREDAIARLVVSGLSNPAVGAKLFVSRRTVESHLARIYRKLGISSRGELAEYVGSSGPSA